jgi:WD40 repeat protein
MTKSGLPVLGFLLLALHPGGLQSADPVSFRKDIAPILADKCLACHKEDKDQGGYRVDSYHALLQPGDSEETPISPGKPEAGLLFHRLITNDEDERMPQKDDPLPAAQINLFKRWIAEGAKFDGQEPQQTLASLLPKKPYAAAPEKYPQPLPITALGWLPDQQTLIVSGYHEVTFWNPSNGQLLRRIGGLPERIFALALHPDGKTLAVAGGVPGRSGEVLVIDVLSGKLIKALPPSDDTQLAVAFSPNGELLAYSGTNNTIHTYKTKDWSPAWKVEAHADWITQLAFSPDSQWLASGSRDRTARSFRTSDGEVSHTITSHGNPVTSVVYAADNKRLFTSANNGEVRVASLGEEGKTGTDVVTGRRVEATRLALADQHLIISSVDGRLRAFDITKKKDDKPLELPALGQRVEALALQPDGKRLVVGGAGGKVQLIDWAEKKVLHTFIASPGWSDK